MKSAPRLPWLLPVAALLAQSGVSQSLPTPYAWFRGEGNALDAIGTNHGTPLNGVSYAAGRTGQAFLFDGVDDSVSLPTSALPSGPSFSVEAWFKMNALTSSGPCNAAGCDQLVFGNQAETNGSGWRILKQAGNQIWILVNGGGATLSTSGTFAAGVWVHTVATFASWGQAGSTVTLYVDGNLIGSAGAYGTFNVVTFGGSPSGANGVFNGLIDEVRIYDVALSPAQVTAAYQSTGSSPGAGPRDVELIDLDGDGDLDVATANEASDNVSLRFNNGQGVLGTDTIVALTASDHAPVALARWDLDNDGSRDDLAVVCADSSTLVQVTDAGAVAGAVVASSGVTCLRPSCIAAGDLDGNPIDDLVVGCEGEPLAGGAGLALVLNGGVAVSLAIPAPHPQQAVEVALGDLDGDGDLDLAAVVLGAGDELLLFAGDGAGAFTFAGALAVATVGLANGLCLADLDRDGSNDLTVVQPQLFPPSQTLRIWRRTGSGALAPGLFTAGSDVTMPGSFAVDLASGDLEDDSIAGFLARVDLAVANVGSGTVTIHHGFTGSAFGSTSSPTVGTNPVAVAIGDLNADGCVDVVVANQGSDDVTVLLTTPSALAQTYGTGCGGPTISAVGLPTLGNPAFGVRVSNARPIAPTLLLFSPGALDTPLPPSTCHLLLATPILQLLAFTNGSGQVTWTFGIPNTPSLSGGDVFFQGAVFHSPGGAFANTLDISDALRLQVGS